MIGDDVLAFELTGVDDNGDPVTLYLATRAFITGDTDMPASEGFREVVSAAGGISLHVFGAGGRTAGMVSPTWGQFSVQNTDGGFDDWRDYRWNGGTIVCRHGQVGLAYPSAWSHVYTATIDGEPIGAKRVTTMSLRGREILFDKPVVTEGFDGSGEEEGTGVAGVQRRRLVLGSPGLIQPILIDEDVQGEGATAWFLHDNAQETRPDGYDGGIPLDDGGDYTDVEDIWTDSIPTPGQFKLAGTTTGPQYAVLGTGASVDFRLQLHGCFDDGSGERAWDIVDLANRAGIADADAGSMPAGSIAYEAGNRVIELETHREVLVDVAKFEVASIGFDQFNQFTAIPIEPSNTGTVAHTFRDEDETYNWTFEWPPGLDGKRVHRVIVRAGRTTKGALAQVVADGSYVTDPNFDSGEKAAIAAVIDPLSRDQWNTHFIASSAAVLADDPNAIEIEVEIIGNEFPDQTAMVDWATRFLRVNGAKQRPLRLEANINPATLALVRLQRVQTTSPRYGTQSWRVIGIDQQLGRRRIGFYLWGHDDVPDDIAIEFADDEPGAAGNGNGTGATGKAPPPIVRLPIQITPDNTVITTGTAKRVIPCWPGDFTLTEIPQFSVVTAQASGSILTADMNDDGTSMLSTKGTIDNTATSSLTAATQPVLSSTVIAKGSRLSFDVDQVGDGTATGLYCSLVGYWL